MTATTLMCVLAQTGEGTQTFWEFLRSGGTLMIPIGVCSVLVLAFALERYVALRRGRVCPDSLDDALTAVHAERFDAARAQLDGDSPGSRVLLAGLRRRGFTVRDVEGVMEDQAQKELERLRRNVRPLTLIAGVAPLLGLLGTVLGIAESFHRVKQAGMGKPEVLAGGIEMALTTTIAGLAVAIPAMLLAAHLHGRVRHLALAMDEKLSPAVESIAGVDRGESHAA